MALAETKQTWTDWDSRLKKAVGIANVPTLLLVLVQMTGAPRWLEPPYAPRRGRGLDDNDSGGLPKETQDEIRTAAFQAIRAWHNGASLAWPDPSPSMLAHMLSVSMGEDVSEDYGDIIKAELSGTSFDQHPVNAPESFRALIIGAGMSGICAAIRLQAAGIPFDIVEKDGDFGGTWRENTYPGAGVDTPNHLYSYSFAQYDWSHYFALRDELYDYFRTVATDYGLSEHTAFHTKVKRASYDTDSHDWQVQITGPDGTETRRYGAIFSAVGVLNIPKVPPIKGLETFSGRSFHTAEWPDDVDLTGKRVGIVGNGASAMQVVPAIAGQVSHLTIFARSKQWAAPFPKFRQPVPDAIRWLIQEVPLYQKWYRQRLAWTFNDRVHGSLQRDPEWEDSGRAINPTNESHRKFFTDYVKEELGDRQDLLDKVLPDYPPFGKRMLLDNGWFRTVAREDVTLVDEHLKEVRGSTLVAGDGSEHEVDVLILGTGFHATELLASLDVVGRDGQALREVWNDDDARAYLGTTVPGFPNLFTLLGPNIGLGHGGSVITPVEAQINYVMDLLEKAFARGARAVEVREDVHDDYNRRVDHAHDNMVWTHPGMENWYRNSKGRVVAITPWRHDDFWRMTREADLGDYELDTP
ncbi:probable monooxygenase [Pseudooceanicola batsensis HTCC2597]|uniref:Probable monooxygenase n=1 Tax=Pseudooceanicola batsensis (strain ATCC BAA-863 / DSM 15984 / KCTC 12145 / HTCC2597) TaxID=252305 RepID=A3TSQ7_PSEBH|nr:NAD(P)/FAD-dependent oxidoreductase [Pseudooceanicola batsensis]EAQ04684.1 probable monooxygenase [Pseudooceanicola batsensis HTCC2597]